MPIDFKPSDNEKTRPCPSCRMMISILATKCRYCGEIVGRPKDETRMMTVEDLGGETIRQYTVSNTVMEAMEAFRAEQELTQGAEDPQQDKHSLLRRRRAQGEEVPGESTPPPPDVPSDVPGLTQLTERQQVLASLDTPRSTPAPRHVARRPPWVTSLAVSMGALVAAVLLFVVFQVMFAAEEPEPDPIIPEYGNVAKLIIAKDGPPIEALEAAIAAQERENIPQNREITDEARRLLVEQVNDLLNAVDWEWSMLEQALELVRRATQLDDDPILQRLRGEVEDEHRAYSMKLDEVDADNEENAKFLLLDPGSDPGAAPSVPHTVEKGDVLNDRFEVVRLGKDYVRMLDKMRGNRYIVYDLSGRIR